MMIANWTFLLSNRKDSFILKWIILFKLLLLTIFKAMEQESERPELKVKVQRIT